MAGGRGPASPPRETGASEVVAVFDGSTWTPKGAREAATRLCWDVVRRPPGWCYALCTPLFLAGRSPLQRGDENDGKVDSALHKAKDTKNRVVYGTKDGEVIQSVYIDKDALGDDPPATLQVVISSQ